jgi:hypothetical protein
MTRLRILHISDLHYTNGGDSDADIVVTALVNDLNELCASDDAACNLMVFSGDLVFSGCSLEDFTACYDKVLLPIAEAAKIQPERIFVTPGNHDICRERVRAFQALQDGLLADLTSTEATNLFLDRLAKGGEQEALAIQRLEGFRALARDRLVHEDHSHPLCSIGEISHCGKRIGLALLNSAWRATGEADDLDQNHLIVGERQVDYALERLDGVDVAIAVMHHPLGWLAPFDRAAIEPLILGSFHVLCVGHLHSIAPRSVITPSGSCIISQSGSMYGGRKWYNGYQIIDIDLLSGEFTFHLREYDDRVRQFGPSRLVRDGEFKLDNPKSVSRDAAGQIELFLRQYRYILRERAKEHLNLPNDSPEYAERVLDEFVAPPLFERGMPDPVLEAAPPGERVEVGVSELLDSGDDLIIIGDRKTGRTSLAFHMALELAAGRSTRTSIPVFVDIRNYKFNFYELRKAVLSFYGPAPKGFELEQSFGEGLYTFFVDNVDVYDEALLKKFLKHSEQFPKCRWVIIATPSTEGVIKDRLLSQALPAFRRIHVGSLPRKLIRKMSNSWAAEKAVDQKTTFETVINQLNRDGLPKTPYMVALVLWALDRRKAGERLNEALLLRNVIEHLLGRADFTLSARSSFNPTAKELVLQEIAFVLREHGGYLDENGLLARLAEFFQKKRLPFSAGDVLLKLSQCGILHVFSGIVSFKYKAFEEYFVALRMQSDNRTLSETLAGLEFLKFKRELELLSGLRQKNDDIIEAITSVLHSRVPERFKKCDGKRIKKFTDRGIGAGTKRAKLNEIRRTRLTDDQVDQIMDEADRRAVARGERPVSESLKESEGDIHKAAVSREAEAIDADTAAESEPLRPGTHMASIDLLAKVIRNSDFTDFEVKGPAASLVLTSWVKILVLMLEEVGEIVRAVEWDDEAEIGDEELEIIDYIMARFLMSIVGETLVNQISSPTIGESIVSVLDEFGPQCGEEILGLFVLEDANHGGWQQRWRDVIRNKESPAFFVDAFTDRLWWIVNRRALDADQSKRVNAVVDALEDRLELRGDEKSQLLENIRSATTMKKLDDSQGAPRAKKR